MGNTLYMCQRRSAQGYDGTYQTTTVKGDPFGKMAAASAAEDDDKDSGCSEDEAEFTLYEPASSGQSRASAGGSSLAILTNPLYDHDCLVGGDCHESGKVAIDAAAAAAAAVACLERVRAEATEAAAKCRGDPLDAGEKPEPVQL